MGKDTNVAILGERDFGAGEGSGDLVYLTISTGVGGAALSGGRPVVGPDLVAGELGHMTVDMDGPLCGCGGVGHVEAFASGTGIAARAAAVLESDAEAPVLRRLAAEIAPVPLTAVHVSRRGRLGRSRRNRHTGAGSTSRGRGGGLHRQRLRPGRGHPRRWHRARVGGAPDRTGPGGRGRVRVPDPGGASEDRASRSSAMTSGLSARSLSSHRPCRSWPSRGDHTGAAAVSAGAITYRQDPESSRPCTRSTWQTTR